MKVATLANIQIPKAPEEVFDFAVACETLAKICKPLGPIPGITSARMADGQTLRKGAHRHVTMSDGSIIEEDVVAFERPLKHGYRWSNRPSFPFSLVVRGAQAEWTFSPAGPGTDVEWRYEFDLTSPVAYPAAMGIVFLFRRWMKSSLERLRAELTA